MVTAQARVFLWASHASQELQTNFTEVEKQQQPHLPACDPVVLLHFPLPACWEQNKQRPPFSGFLVRIVAHSTSIPWWGELSAKVQEAPAELLKVNPIFNVQWAARSYKTVHMV